MPALKLILIGRNQLAYRFELMLIGFFKSLEILKLCQLFSEFKFQIPEQILKVFPGLLDGNFVNFHQFFSFPGCLNQLFQRKSKLKVFSGTAAAKAFEFIPKNSELSFGCPEVNFICFKLWIGPEPGLMKFGFFF